MKKENRNQIKSAGENGGNPDTVSPKMIQSDVHQKKKKKIIFDSYKGTT